MNILLIVLILLAVWRGWHGLKKGLVGEAGWLLSLLISLFILSLAILLYTSVRQQDTKNIVLSVLMILATGLAARLLGMLIKTLSAIAHLPVLSLLNSLLGLVVGVAEAVVVLWIVYVVVVSFDTGTFGELILEWTRGNEWLSRLYQMNWIACQMAAGL